VIEAVTGTSINRAMRILFRPLASHAGDRRRFHRPSVRRPPGLVTTGMLRPFSPSVSVTAGGVGLYHDLAYANFIGNGIAQGRALLSAHHSNDAHHATAQARH
jgi:hypothetical protein